MLETPNYFYRFLEPINKELALVARELEQSIYTSPRTMLTHARILIDTILQLVMKHENLEAHQYISLKDRMDELDRNGYVTPEVRDALHQVRQLGNQAAHQARNFRVSEALQSWESIYIAVKWYLEVYGPIDLDVPDYQDPEYRVEQGFEMPELEARLQKLEDLLKDSMLDEAPAKEEMAAAVEVDIMPELPGFTPIRTISYKGRTLDIPYFLRDAFLLPQRFEKSETFLIRLGAEQEARIMSELPDNLEGFHLYVKRFNEKNDETLFDELNLFIQEEKIRRRLLVERPGELFYFFKDRHIVITKELAEVPLSTEEFTGIPSLIRQLNDVGKTIVADLPRELVTLAKYKNAGIGTIEKLFEQMKVKLG